MRVVELLFAKQPTGLARVALSINKWSLLIGITDEEARREYGHRQDGFYGEYWAFGPFFAVVREF
jgi:hypothetical protein